MRKNIIKISGIIYIITILFGLPVYSAEKMRIVVMELKAEGVSGQDAKIISNMIRTDIINLKKFTVIERSQVDQIIQEQGFQQAACTDQECAVQMGKILSAKKILIGEVSAIAQKIIITVRIVDVEKGISDYAARQDASSMESVDKAVRQISAELAGRIEADRIETERSKIGAGAGYYMRGLVPGWGQIYSGHNIKGYVFTGAFVLSGAFAGYSLYDFMNKRTEYDDAGDPESATDKYDKSQKAMNTANIAMGIFAAVYAANIVDILFFSRPENNSLSSHADPAKFKEGSLAFNLYQNEDILNGSKINFSLGMRF